MVDKVSIVTRAKNRLKHIIYSLPRLLAQTYRPLEVVVVNYDSKDGLHEYLQDHYAEELESGLLVEKVVTDTPGFLPAHAWNVGIKASTGDTLFLCDSDLLVNTEFVEIAMRRMTGQKKLFCRAFDEIHKDLAGLFFVHREDILALGGFNETFHGWGYEDGDLRQRLLLYGCDALCLNTSGMVRPIEHPDLLRMKDLAGQVNNKIIGRDLNATRALFCQHNFAYRANVGTDWGK